MVFLRIIYDTKKSVSLIDLEGGLFYLTMSVSGLILGIVLIGNWIRQYILVSDAIERLEFSNPVCGQLCIMRQNRNRRIFIGFSAAAAASVVLFVLSFVMINLHG